MNVSKNDRTSQARLRGKTARVSQLLESFLGKPVQAEAPTPPLEMLIATILSQNTNDKNSHRAYSLLRKKFPTWPEVAIASARSIASCIRVGGMANQKSVRIKETLRTVRKRFGSYDLSALNSMSNEEVINELCQMKGVGTKTAACVLLFSMRRDVFPVDTHVHRICGRLGLAGGSKSPDQTFELMRGLVPRKKAYSFHTNLIRFGRKICRSNNPACELCPLYSECVYPAKKRRGDVKRAPSAAHHDFMLLDNI